VTPPPSNTGVVTGVRVAHDTATLEAIESVRERDQEHAVQQILGDPAVEEAFCLQTCHRFEIYVVADSQSAGRDALQQYTIEGARKMDHEASLGHLLRVSAGLESLVLGEDQILGQVRDARDDARTAGGIGPILGEALRKALHVGERVRTETSINDGVVSLGSAAVSLLETKLELATADAVVVGAGEMGTLAARALQSVPVNSLTVANRTPENAAELISRLEGAATTTDLSTLSDTISQADVILTATSSEEAIIDETTLEGAEALRIVDLGQPRDVDPDTALPSSVELFDITDLESITQATHERRATVAKEVDAMVETELQRLLDSYKRQRADAVIQAMYQSASGLKRRELETAFNQLEAAGDLNEDQREIVSELAETLVAKLLAAPTKSLRDAASEDDWQTITTALELFDPNFEEGVGSPVAAADDSPSSRPGENQAQASEED